MAKTYFRLTNDVYFKGTSDVRWLNRSILFGDSLSLSDVFSRTVEYFRTFPESLSLADVIKKELERSLADSLGLSDAIIIKDVEKKFSETLSLSETFAKDVKKNLADNVPLVDAIAKTINKPLSDTIALLDGYFYGFVGFCYREGEVDVEKGSKNVVGRETEWEINVVSGDWFKIEEDPVWYEIDVIVDDTHITLKENFRGDTAIGLIYMILRDFTDNFRFAEIQISDIDYHDIWNKAMMEIDRELQKIEDRIEALEP